MFHSRCRGHLTWKEELGCVVAALMLTGIIVATAHWLAYLGY